VKTWFQAFAFTKFDLYRCGEVALDDITVKRNNGPDDGDSKGGTSGGADRSAQTTVGPLY
jgi:hypothetical protein